MSKNGSARPRPGQSDSPRRHRGTEKKVVDQSTAGLWLTISGLGLRAESQLSKNEKPGLGEEARLGGAEVSATYIIWWLSIEAAVEKWDGRVATARLRGIQEDSERRDTTFGVEKSSRGFRARLFWCGQRREGDSEGVGDGAHQGGFAGAGGEMGAGYIQLG